MQNAPSSSRNARRSAGFESIFSLFLFAGVLILINYFGFKYYYHKDLSKSQYYTLSARTIDVLKKLDSPVTITTLLNDKDPVHADQIDRLLQEYQRVGGKNIVVDKIDLAFDAARAAELQKRLQFQVSDFLIIFEYKDRIRFVKQQDVYEMNPLSQQAGAFRGEQQFTSAIVSIVEGRASRVYFTEGHGEHSIHDVNSPQGYGGLVPTLKSENIEPADLNLAAKGEVPADADAVVIAGPSIAFSPLEAEAINRYLQNNGKVFLLVDPYVTFGLDNVLQNYGLKYENDLVLYRGMTATGSLITVPIALIYQGGFSNQPITAKFAAANYQLQLSNARSITILPDDKGQPNPKAQFLMQTDADSWGWVSANGAVPANPRTLTYNKVTDIAGPVTVAAQYDGGTTTDPNTKTTVPATRIVAVGCAKFLENDMLEAVGLNFFSNSLDWLVKKDAVLDIIAKPVQEYGLSVSPIQYRTIAWTSMIFIPGAALAMGIFTWFSRRK